MNKGLYWHGMISYLYEQLNVWILILIIWRDQVSHCELGFINFPYPTVSLSLRLVSRKKACTTKNILTVLTVCPAECSDGRATSAWGTALFWFGPWAQLSGVQHALPVTLRPKIASKEEREELQMPAPVSPTPPPHTHSLAFISCQQSHHFQPLL